MIPLPRVQPGMSFHLFTKHQLGLLADYQLPEMQRIPLEELALQIKILRLGRVEEFLSKAIEPPTEAAIHDALTSLRQLVHACVCVVLCVLCVWVCVCVLEYHSCTINNVTKTNPDLLFITLFLIVLQWMKPINSEAIIIWYN